MSKASGFLSIEPIPGEDVFGEDCQNYKTFKLGNSLVDKAGMV